MIEYKAIVLGMGGIHDQVLVLIGAGHAYKFASALGASLVSWW